MALLTPEDVIAWVPQAAANGALIESAIVAAQGLANGYCLRQLERADHDERFSPDWEQEEISLREYPVTEIVVTEGSSANVVVLTEGTHYWLDAEAGIVTRIGCYWWRGARTVRVQYTAGYTPEDLADPVTGDLQTALLELVAWRMGMRGSAGVQQESSDGVTTVVEAKMRGIPAGIAGMLERYRRKA